MECSLNFLNLPLCNHPKNYTLTRPRSAALQYLAAPVVATLKVTLLAILIIAQIAYLPFQACCGKGKCGWANLQKLSLNFLVSTQLILPICGVFLYSSSTNVSQNHTEINNPLSSKNQTPMNRQLKRKKITSHPTTNNSPTTIPTPLPREEFPPPLIPKPTTPKPADISSTTHPLNTAFGNEEKATQQIPTSIPNPAPPSTTSSNPPSTVPSIEGTMDPIKLDSPHNTGKSDTLLPQPSPKFIVDSITGDLIWVNSTETISSPTGPSITTTILDWLSSFISTKPLSSNKKLKQE